LGSSQKKKTLCLVFIEFSMSFRMLGFKRDKIAHVIAVCLRLKNKKRR
jgi:hypothetical protein